MQQLIFIHIPKTAGVAVANTLKENNILLQSQAKRTTKNYGFIHKYARDAIKDEHKHYPTVAVVRNPFDRIYSVFEFYQKKRDNIPKNLTFEEFVLSFKTKFLNKNHQFTDCFQYVCDSQQHKVIVTDILKFETLEQDFNNLGHKYGFFAALQKLNNNELKKTDIDPIKLFSEEMRKEVEDIFSRDMKTFGYTYEQFLETKIK